MEKFEMEVEKDLQYAYEVCRDSNAYTSHKTVGAIINDGTASLQEDKVAFAYYVFPELRQ